VARGIVLEVNIIGLRGGGIGGLDVSGPTPLALRS
jgi:hypothetical protein